MRHTALLMQVRLLSNGTEVGFVTAAVADSVGKYTGKLSSRDGEKCGTVSFVFKVNAWLVDDA